MGFGGFPKNPPYSMIVYCVYCGQDKDNGHTFKTNYCTECGKRIEESHIDSWKDTSSCNVSCVEVVTLYDGKKISSNHMKAIWSQYSVPDASAPKGFRLGYIDNKGHKHEKTLDIRGDFIK